MRRRARLVREARAAAALNHASICTIHDVGEAEGQAYIAMELVEGKPLSEIVHAKGLTFDEVVNYGSQIAEALVHAHARGVIHRDLKSANVVVTSDGRVKVLDFGLAKKGARPELSLATTRQDAGASLTERGTVVGTIAYMAPEQLRGEAADARSDLWALGVVLYEMCAGAPPFTGRSGFEVSAHILSRPASPFRRMSRSRCAPSSTGVSRRIRLAGIRRRARRAPRFRPSRDVQHLGRRSVTTLSVGPG